MPDPTEQEIEQPVEGEPSLVDMIATNIGVSEEVEPFPEDAAKPDEPVVEAEPAAKTPEELAAEQAIALSPEAEAAAEKAKSEKAVEDELKTLGITNEKSQARFRELANEAAEARALKTEFAEIKTAYERQDQVFKRLDDEGVTGDQFGLMVALAGDVNSGDPMRQKRAYEHLMAEATGLAKILGIEAPGFDPISAHPDLAKEVEEGAIDRARALELAQHRQTSQRVQQHTRQREAQTQSQAAVQAGKDSLNALEAELKRRDPQYAAKRNILLPSIQAAFAHIPPADWATHFANAYKQLALPAAPAAAVTARPDPHANGRPNGAAGAPAPKSAAEAIMQQFGISTD